MHVQSLSPLLRAAKFKTETLGYRMKLASHSILSGAAATTFSQFPQFDFLSNEELHNNLIDGLTGLSPELMQIIQECNKLACTSGDSRTNIGCRYLDRLQTLEQINPCPSDDPVKNWTIFQTAESYRLAAMLYIYCRILR